MNRVKDLLPILLLVGAMAVAAVGPTRQRGRAAPASPTPTADPAVVACLEKRSIQLLNQHRRTRPPEPALYLVPLGEQDLIIPEDVLAANRIEVVSSFKELKRQKHANPSLRVIYLHPEALNEVDGAWLRKEYESGAAIVALNTLASDLGEMLGIAPPLEDLRLEFRRGRAYLTIFERAAGYGGEEQEFFADFVEQPSAIPLVVSQVVDAYHLSEAYLKPLEACLEGK